MDFSVLTCDDALQHKGTNTVLYYTIMHVIAEYGPQLVKQAPKLRTSCS